MIRVIQPIKQNNEAQNLLLIMVHAGGLGDGGIEAKRRNSWWCSMWRHRSGYVSDAKAIADTGIINRRMAVQQR